MSGEDKETRRQEDLALPLSDRLYKVAAALGDGVSAEKVSELTGYDLWFTEQLQQIINLEKEVGRQASHFQFSIFNSQFSILLRAAKRLGFSDKVIAQLTNSDEMTIRALRKQHGLTPNYYRVDTCAAEFEAHTPYLYSTYESGDEAQVSDRKKVMILGGGPNRIGQGIEFDYCCVQACWALSDLGYETIMVNCNPETVSTDYDTADRLYFEPLTLEDVLNIVDAEQPDGVIVQFGGQTPINLSNGLEAAGVPIWGTSADSIDLAEDRGRFGDLLRELNVDHPQWGLAYSQQDAIKIVARISFPVLVRPSFVLGGRAMAIAYDQDSLIKFFDEAIGAQEDKSNPVLIDQFIEDAFEVDVDCIADGENVIMAGVMQHIEQAGIHSGDSACVLPPYKIGSFHLSVMREYCEKLGRALKVKGLMNVQFAIRDDVVYVIEVNPRASRTVPFVSKATGVRVAQLAAKAQAGMTLAELGITDEPNVDGFFVKEVVLPFNKLPGADTRLGPEMRSTGEVMGHAARFGHAYAKAQMAAGETLPTEGAVLVTVNDFDKSAVLRLARSLHGMDFKLYATEGTAQSLEKIGVPVISLAKASGGTSAENTVTLIESGTIDLIINTPYGQQSHKDGQQLRAAAIKHGVPLVTTLSAAQAAVNGIRALRSEALTVRSLQAHHAK